MSLAASDQFVLKPQREGGGTIKIFTNSFPHEKNPKTTVKPFPKTTRVWNVNNYVVSVHVIQIFWHKLTSSLKFVWSNFWSTDKPLRGSNKSNLYKRTASQDVYSLIRSKLKDSCLLSLILNLSNTDALGWWSAQPTNPQFCTVEYLEWADEVKKKW